MDKKEAAALKIKAAKIRIAALTAFDSLGNGHVGGSLSICDALAVLYGREMKVDPKNPGWPDRDKLVTSKGHAGPGIYGALAVEGYFPYDELKTLNKPHTHLPSHTDRNLTTGVDMTTGSLGQGTSVACGMALGDRLKGRKNRIFLIVGDGECDEGQVWEAFAFAAAKKLSNLVVLIDMNKKQLDGRTDEIMPLGSLEDKMKVFGFNTQLVNGNDVEAMAQALENTRGGGDKPYAIIMDTIKGAGVKEVEETEMNHSIPVSHEQYARWKAELEAEIAGWEALL